MKDVFGNVITIEDMAKMQSAMEEAHKDDTPFPVITKDGLTVVGDPNKTEKKTHDYVMEFHFKPEELKKYGIKEEAVERWVAGEAVLHREYTDVSVMPRYKLEIDASLVKILPYFYNVNEETKRVEKRSDEDMRVMVRDMSIDIGDDLYNFVAAVLQIDRRIVNNMEWTCVVNTASQLIIDFPEVLNSSESTFPSADSIGR